MLANESRDQKRRHIATYRDGQSSIFLYESEGREFWRLVRDTEKGPVEVGAGERHELKELSKILGGADRLPKVAEENTVRPNWLSAITSKVATLTEFGKSVFNREPKGPRESEVKPTDVFYAAIRLSELTQTGGRGGVVASFTELSKLQRFCDMNPGVAMYPQPFASRPEKGTRIEITNRELSALNARGQGKDLNHQFERLQWKESQGKYFQVGYWNDTVEMPHIGQLAHFTEGRDYRDHAVDRLVSPLGRFSPGQPQHPQPVVYELSSRNGIGRIAAIPRDLQAAEIIAKELNQSQALKERSVSQEAWRELETGTTPRGIAEFEKRQTEPQLTNQAKQLDSDSSQLKLRSIVKGNFIADVSERTQEDGSLARSVLITHRYMDRDGVERSAGVTFSLEELLNQGLENSLVKERLKGLQQTTPEVTKELELPPPQQDRRVQGRDDRPQGQHRQDQGQDDHLQGQVQHEQNQDRHDQGGNHLDRNQLRDDQGARGQQERGFKLVFPSLNPDPPANGVQGNRHWVAGVWHGTEQPVKGHFAYFTQGVSSVSDRMIIPGALDAKYAEPGDRPQYVLGELVAKNVIRIVGATKDLDYVVQQEASREQKAVKLAQNKEHTASLRSPARMTMEDLNQILSLPMDQEAAPSSIAPREIQRPHENGIMM